ncbi:YbaB/EbfC family nucleoid-associated protein [Micromonospora craniellae]|uniref:YbaB/EbfC family nucleoid-associated protein n=1 Tax=Micromonospora craniellae TaxID=2294034 RepID=UPI0011C14092|nr:YbaB/EbfC family nucleoid-associated protein [Micromonospora craniellae]QOC93841.1 YbaB/EbfC family nucleoid-associated protein [Micromonospora craniellae]
MSGQADFSGLLARTQAIEHEVAELAQSMSKSEVVGSAAGGGVTVTVADSDYQAVYIDPQLMESCDADELADLVLAALRDGAEQLRVQASERMTLLTESINRLAG